MKLSRSILIMIGCAMVMYVLSVQAKTKSIVGVVSKVDAGSLQVNTREGSSESVRLDNETTYMKWINHRPWGQDANVDRKSLEVGRCVAIDIRSGEPAIAKLIRISNESVGTIWYPCHN